MSRLTFAIAGRVLRQLRHDPRSVALVTLVPIVLVTLLHEIFAGAEPLVSHIELSILAVFPLFIMFLLTAVATVRERTSGTLESLMASPIHRADIILGYTLAYGVFALVQSAFTTLFCYWALDMRLTGSVFAVLLVSFITAVLGIALGLLASAVSRNEFQAVQLTPAIIVPQVLLCGLLGERDEMAEWLHQLSNAMPLSWSVDALEEVAQHSNLTSHYWSSLGIVVGCTALALALASRTLRRKTP